MAAEAGRALRVPVRIGYYIGGGQWQIKSKWIVWFDYA